MSYSDCVDWWDYVKCTLLYILKGLGWLILIALVLGIIAGLVIAVLYALWILLVVFVFGLMIVASFCDFIAILLNNN